MQDQPSTNFSRVIGTETEFGIAAKDAALSDPVAGSIAVIDHYPGLPAPNAIWDYENENPLLDARGFEVEGEGSELSGVSSPPDQDQGDADERPADQGEDQEPDGVGGGPGTGP